MAAKLVYVTTSDKKLVKKLARNMKSTLISLADK
jgi:hypothetical protein